MPQQQAFSMPNQQQPMQPTQGGHVTAVVGGAAAPHFDFTAATSPHGTTGAVQAQDGFNGFGAQSAPHYDLIQQQKAAESNGLMWSSAPGSQPLMPLMEPSSPTGAVPGSGLSPSSAMLPSGGGGAGDSSVDNLDAHFALLAAQKD
jgi:hypothetical protein